MVDSVLQAEVIATRVNPENVIPYIQRAVDLLRINRMEHIELAELMYPIYANGGYAAFVAACADAGITPPTKGWVSRLSSVWEFWGIQRSYPKELLARTSINRLYAIQRAYEKGILAADELERVLQVAIVADDATFKGYVSEAKEEGEVKKLEIPTTIYEALVAAAERVAGLVRHPLSVVAFLEIVAELAMSLPEETWRTVWGIMHGETKEN